MFVLSEQAQGQFPQPGAEPSPGVTVPQTDGQTGSTDGHRQFDEAAYLSGQIPLISGEAKRPTFVSSGGHFGYAAWHREVSRLPLATQADCKSTVPEHIVLNVSLHS